LPGCTTCGGIDNEDCIILCDGENCSAESHLYCLSPPLLEVPSGEWYCEECENNRGGPGTIQTFNKYITKYEIKIFHKEIQRIWSNISTTSIL
jgi:hypothetical protein